MTMTKAQQIMVADGCPAALFIPQAQRAAAWAAMPLRPMPRFDEPVRTGGPTPEAVALLAEQEEKHRLKAKARIGKLLRSKEVVDRTGQRWDSRRNKWVSDAAISGPSASPREARPLAGDLPASRATPTRKNAPNRLAAAESPGSGAVARAGQAGGMRSTARAIAKGAKAGSKAAIIEALLRRPEGCTSADVLAATGWSAVSMPQQAKAIGVELVVDKINGRKRYRAG